MSFKRLYIYGRRRKHEREYVNGAVAENGQPPAMAGGPDVAVVSWFQMRRSIAAAVVAA